MCASFSTFFQFSCHMPGPTLYTYNFLCFSVFLAIFQVLPCEILIFLVSQFSYPITGPTVCVSHFPHFFKFSSHIPGPKVFVSHFAHFSVFSPYFRSYSVSFSFSSFVIFLIIFQVRQCLCLIFHVFNVSRHIIGPTM